MISLRDFLFVLRNRRHLLFFRQWVEAEQRKADRHRLKLCFHHRQEDNQSHYAQHNCDHCSLLRELGRPLPEDS